METNAKILDAAQSEEMLRALEARFAANMPRHADIEWAAVRARLDANPHNLWSLHEMERTGGEPDVLAQASDVEAFWFVDCAKESPAGRRNLCYDREARLSRKAHSPESSALEMAEAMGIALLTEDQYRALQQLEAVDERTSSWIATPEAVRALGGALFCDRRYQQVFVYHNGAESYYGARGFRGLLRV